MYVHCHYTLACGHRLCQDVSMAAKTTRNEKLDIRLSAEAKALLQQAAESRHKTLSEFVLDSALGAAEDVLKERNVIALDAAHNVIQDQRLIVIRDEARVLNLHKGGSRLSYNCTPNCNLTLTIGDDFGHFENLGKNTDKKLKMGDNSAENSDQSSQ